MNIDACSPRVMGSHFVTLRSAGLEIKQYQKKKEIGENEINRIFGDITELEKACLALNFSVDASQFISFIV